MDEPTLKNQRRNSDVFFERRLRFKFALENRPFILYMVNRADKKNKFYKFYGQTVLAKTIYFYAIRSRDWLVDST